MALMASAYVDCANCSTCVCCEYELIKITGWDKRFRLACESPDEDLLKPFPPEASPTPNPSTPSSSFPLVLLTKPASGNRTYYCVPTQQQGSIRHSIGTKTRFEGVSCDYLHTFVLKHVLATRSMAGETNGNGSLFDALQMLSQGFFRQ